MRDSAARAQQRAELALRSPDRSGAVAQLGERLVCNQEATGSIPVSSTNSVPSLESSVVS
jgi:hypothetical protein